jgi:hypothetical protein
MVPMEVLALEGEINPTFLRTTSSEEVGRHDCAVESHVGYAPERLKPPVIRATYLKIEKLGNLRACLSR